MSSSVVTRSFNIANSTSDDDDNAQSSRDDEDSEAIRFDELVVHGRGEDVDELGRAAEREGGDDGEIMGNTGGREERGR
jgi:hypothetical protein